MKHTLMQRMPFFATLCLALATIASAHPTPLADPLKVVCTLPDLADLTREIGGDRVDVTTIYKGKENTHAVMGKPSHLVAMSRADVFVQIGLSLESSIVPGLLENCRNQRIQPGKPGFVNVSAGWNPLDVPTVLTRKDGDVHPEGNPHMNLDPRAGKHMARVIHDQLVLVDAPSKAGYDQRYEMYVKKLDEASARWMTIAKEWGSRKVVVYHKEYDYLTDAYGIAIQGSIENKPGIPPTPNHLASLIDAMKRDPGAVILTAQWSNNDNVEQVARETGAKVVELPNMCGGTSGAETWIGMMDTIHKRVAEAFATASAAR